MGGEMGVMGAGATVDLPRSRSRRKPAAIWALPSECECALLEEVSLLSSSPVEPAVAPCPAAARLAAVGAVTIAPGLEPVEWVRPR